MYETPEIKFVYYKLGDIILTSEPSDIFDDEYGKGDNATDDDEL